jgi:hypothetical protein
MTKAHKILWFFHVSLYSTRYSHYNYFLRHTRISLSMDLKEKSKICWERLINRLGKLLWSNYSWWSLCRHFVFNKSYVKFTMTVRRDFIFLPRTLRVVLHFKCPCPCSVNSPVLWRPSPNTAHLMQEIYIGAKLVLQFSRSQILFNNKTLLKLCHVMNYLSMHSDHGMPTLLWVQN